MQLGLYRLAFKCDIIHYMNPNFNLPSLYEVVSESWEGKL